VIASSRVRRHLLTALLVSGPGWAQTQESMNGGVRRWPIDVEEAPRPEVSAVRIEQPIVVDGRLDEEAWKKASPITGFIQSTPRTGYPATERTVARVLYDQDNLYVGAICYDSEPERLVVPSLKQDFSTHDSDTFGVALDTFLDRRDAFLFLVNPKGAVWEAQDFNDSESMNLAWEGIIKLKTRIHEEGWTVEMAIPFTTLRFDPGKKNQSWGLNFMRRIRKNNEEAYWAPLAKRDRLHKMSKAGTLQDLRGIRPGRNLAVKPYVLASRQTTTATGSDMETELDGGFDLKYGVTPGLTLDLTYRTDFSQVEVDQERVNLTRFSLFFPEKRDFFIENSGIFNFGDVSERNYRTGSSPQEFSLFHSRRIGLDDQGQPITILGGARFTGRIQAFELGVLDMQTRAEGDLSPENFAVLRLRKNVGRSDIGAIFINRQVTDGGAEFNRSYGLDANVRLLRNLIVNSYLARTDDSEVEGNQWAGRVAVGWRDRLWDTSFFVKHVGDAFVPRVGFVRRRGIRHGYATFGAHPRPSIAHVQEMNPYGELHYITNLHGELETRNVTLGLGVEFLDGGNLSCAVDDRFERLFEDFPISTDATVPVGDYHFREESISYSSSGGRPLSGEASVTWGGFYNGNKTTLDLGARWRLDYHLSVDVFGQHNKVSIPGNDFTADVYGARVDYAYSTHLFANAFVQYNVAGEELVMNLRFNYIHSPLSDLFLVYNERRDMTGGGVLDRIFTVKVTKLFAF
jgi:hypothetical protein